MTDPQRDLALAALTVLALAATGIAVALWGRLNHLSRVLADVEAHQDAMQAWATDTHGDVEHLFAAAHTHPAHDEVDPEPPTTPIGDHLDRWRDHFTFAQEGRRP